ncbi:MAG: type 1 glutamine amidotransferase domain-containing protein [Bdellovibrionales bacterium]
MSKNQISLNGRKVAVLATNGFEYSELTKPLEALRECGAQTMVVSPEEDFIRGWQKGNWTDKVKVDLSVNQAKASDFDALVLPGGVMNPDALRINENAVQFVRDFFESGKPIAAICHGPWLLIDAADLKGKKVTSWPSLKCDLENAGAQWVDQEVVVDQGIVTSRKPDDLEAFCSKLIEEIQEGRHEKRQVNDKRSGHGRSQSLD